jgi:putative SOS response-associated peptidase YedK
MLLNYLTLATPVSTIESVFQVQFQNSFIPTYRFSADMALPVITHESEKTIILLPWGIQSFKRQTFKQHWIQSDGILKNLRSRALIRTHRCVVLTNCFYINNNGEILLIYNPKEPVLFLAGIWNVFAKPAEVPVSGFSVITRSAPQQLVAYTEQVPVIIPKSGVRSYLNIRKPLMDISRMLREHYYPGMNGYRINPSILARSEWSRENLLPEGEKKFSTRKSSDKTILKTRNYFW